MKEKNKGKRVVISASERVSMLPPYLFAEIDRQKETALKKGMELIDFGIGDPDMPTPSGIVQEAREAVAEGIDLPAYPSFGTYASLIDPAYWDFSVRPCFVSRVFSGLKLSV